MKTMTCKQLGGPCDLAHHGDTADEVIKAQDAHLRDAVARGDAAHEPALQDMKGRWKHPIAGMGWYKKAKRDFAGLPMD
jgi:predicted small metal-binding protein